MKPSSLTPKSLARRAAALVIVGIVGLTMLFYALERASLVMFTDGAGARPPLRIYLTLFVGLAIVNLCVFYGFTMWARYARTHPETRHLPVWFLLAVLVIGGGALVTSMATHAGYLRSLDAMPAAPNMGYVGFQVIAAAFVLVPLVLLCARFAPGYKRPVPAVIPD
ncbi:hypothetical protein [Demequina sp. NBRC 110053]|uniref:hypothetical protein n=1 Tax=Demequina sp. NBRC 110053 TaxID=1570342 RepID=UPI000A079A06|nr:hypothetical protein [Demequina sp. NBRC 110053]